MLEVKKKSGFFFHHRTIENFDHDVHVAIQFSQKGFWTIFFMKDSSLL